MKDKFSLVSAIFGLIKMAFLLINQPKIVPFFGFKLNGWLYFSMWLLFTVVSLHHFIVANKKKYRLYETKKNCHCT